MSRNVVIRIKYKVASKYYKTKNGKCSSDIYFNEDFEWYIIYKRFQRIDRNRITTFSLIIFSTKKIIIYYIDQVTKAPKEHRYTIHFLRKNEHNGFIFLAITYIVCIRSLTLLLYFQYPFQALRHQDKYHNSVLLLI